VLSGGDEKEIAFELNHFSEESEVPKDQRALRCVAVSPNFNFLASVHGNTLQLWIYHPSKKGDKPPDKFKILTAPSSITCLSFSADEKYVAFGTEQKTIHVPRSLLNNFLLQHPFMLTFCLR